MIKHPLNNKLAWAKLAIGLALAVVGILTQFDITVNQNTVKAATTSNPASFPAVERTYITEAACRGIKKGDKIEDLRDRFRYDDENGDFDMPLAEDHDRDCIVFDNYDGEVDAVMLVTVAF